MMPTLVSVRCPRCQGGLVEPSYRDRDYTCVMCGERWPNPSIQAEAVINPSLIIEDGHKRGRRSNQARILEMMSDGIPRTTTAIAEAITGANRSNIERQLWKLETVGALKWTRSVSGAVLWWAS